MNLTAELPQRLAAISTSHLADDLKQVEAQIRLRIEEFMGLGEMLEKKQKVDVVSLGRNLSVNVENVLKLQQILGGLSNAALTAERIGLSKNASTLQLGLNQGLEEFKMLLQGVSKFRDDVKHLEKLWTEADIHNLVLQNHAWLKLIKSPFHQGVPHQDHGIIHRKDSFAHGSQNNLMHDANDLSLERSQRLGAIVDKIQQIMHESTEGEEEKNRSKKRLALLEEIEEQIKEAILDENIEALQQ